METDALEEKVVAIYEKLGCNIPTEFIEASHRISKKTPLSLSSFLEERTISRFEMLRETCEK